ncbi:MAG: lipoate--protein ligase family protein [Chlamydiales bacterium]
MDWKVVDTGIDSAENNMQLDAQLLQELGSDPILHFYEWERPSISYGYFIHPEKLLNLDEVRKRGIDLARRPTGGGVVFHLWDFAFSLLVPASSPHFSHNPLDNYAFVNQAVLEATQEFLTGKEKWELIKHDAPAWDEQCSNFCMAKPTKYDVVLAGRKIAGAAQRKRKQGFLHQGTIALVMPPKQELASLLLPGNRVLEATLGHTMPLLDSAAHIPSAKEKLKTLLQKSLSQNR